MVESAIVLPMYVFLMLGLLQLGLAHQARTLTKYAAYKAARAGALNNASVSEMESAALGVLLPLLSRKSSGTEIMQPTTDATSYITKYAYPGYLANRMLDYPALSYVDVTICGPLKGDFGDLKEVDFDDPRYKASAGWEQYLKTKLRIQVTFNYRMPIPFANNILHAFVYGRETSRALRMDRPFWEFPSFNLWAGSALAGVYAMPIRANYNMRMMSNIYVTQAPLPEENLCVIPFGKQ